jgi:cardiolipin synthase
MLAAIGRARETIHLESYAFDASGVGARFVEALQQAAERGTRVHVVLDGWGSVWDSRAVASALREAGCEVVIFNRLRSLFVGQLGRNHRKILLVDDEIAFIGGINIGDENLGRGARVGWADLTLEIQGPQCARLGQKIRGERPTSVVSAMSMHLCGLGGGWRLRRRYIASFAAARHRLDIAHGYFLPDRGVLRAITAAAGRGVRVRLLLAGQTDVPLAGLATRRLYRRLLEERQGGLRLPQLRRV